jgi:hypothetical protein
LVFIRDELRAVQPLESITIMLSGNIIAEFECRLIA